MNRRNVCVVLGLSFLSLTLLITNFFKAIPASAASSFYYTFNSAGTLYEAASADKSTGQYLWLKTGGKLVIQNGIGETAQSSLLLARTATQNVSAQVYVNRVSDNVSGVSWQPYFGESLIARYKDDNNYYYAGVRTDGYAVIKKKTGGVYKTLATKKIFAGTYNASTNPDLIPLNKWIGLKMSVTNSANNVPTISFYTDVGQTGNWQLVLSVADDPAKFGAAITEAGLSGVQNDYARVRFDNLLIADSGSTSSSNPVTATTTSAAPPVTATTTTTTTTASAPSYDSTVLTDKPVMFLTMGSPSAGSETDKSGRGHTGTYKGGSPAATSLPNGDTAANFNGSNQYLTVTSSADLSISTTKQLTWEAWIRPDTLQFPNDSGYGYIDWMGKCQDYSPTCEWEARMYSLTNPEGRTSRLSAYVFNPTAGLGSAADWQPASGVIQSGKWLHVVAEYDTVNTPSGCSTAYPGQINIWVNGVKQNFAAHAPTGCMSQYKVAPKAGASPLNIGTMALETWFKGAIGKVAVYNYLLSQNQISNHFKTMTGRDVSGSCGATCTVPVE